MLQNLNNHLLILLLIIILGAVIFLTSQAIHRELRSGSTNIKEMRLRKHKRIQIKKDVLIDNY